MKKIFCIFLVVLLLITSTVPALAAATSSNSDFRLEDYLDNYKKIPLPADNPGLGVVPDASVHTSSDSDIWIGDDGLPVVDFSAPAPYEIELLSSGKANSVVCYARTSKGVLHADLGSDYYETFEFPSLTDGSYYKEIEFQFKTDKDVLPDPGTYEVTLKLFDNLGNIRDTGVDNVAADTFNMQDGGKNSPGIYHASPTNVTFNKKNWTVKCTIKTNYNTDFVSYTMTLYTDVPINQVSLRLIEVLFKADATSTPALSAPGDVGSAENHIANQSSQIAQNTATMNDTLKEIVQTISKQLEALWNQQYNYIHLEDMANADKNADKIIANQDENTSIVTDAIEEHGNFIIEGLKRLFIPSDEFFKEYFDDLYNWFSGKFGFLTIPIDILVQILDVFTTSQKVDFIVTLPPLSIMGEEVWPQQSFNFTDFMEKDFAFLITAIQTGTSILLIMSFIDLCRKKYDEVMRS